MASRCYVYAVISRDLPLPESLTGFGGAKLFPITCRDLTMVASIVDSAEIPPVPEHLLLHEAVVDAIRVTGPALPVRFGTTLPNPEAVVEAICGRYAVLRSDLERLGDKVELGLTVLWTPPPTDGRDANQRLDVASLGFGTEIGAGARHLIARLVENRREACWQSEAAALTRRIDCNLRRHASESHCVVMPTRRLAMRAAYLLFPSQLAEFHKAFDELRITNPHLRLLLSGTWPPYSFVTPPSASQERRLETAEASWLAEAASQLLCLAAST